jgi:hypothetical protein
VVSKDQYDRVNAYLAIGRGEARLASGGGRPAALNKGYYIEPTIFYDVDNSARIAREEIFGAISTKPFVWSSSCAPASSGSITCNPLALRLPGADTSNPAPAAS